MQWCRKVYNLMVSIFVTESFGGGYKIDVLVGGR